MLRSFQRLKCCPKEWRRRPIGAIVLCRNLTPSVRDARATPFFNIRPRLAWSGSSDFAPCRRKRGSCVRTSRRTGGAIDRTRGSGRRGGYRRRTSTRGPVDTRFWMPDSHLCAVEFDRQIWRSLAKYPAREYRHRAGNDRAGRMVAGCSSVRLEASRCSWPRSLVLEPPFRVAVLAPECRRVPRISRTAARTGVFSDRDPAQY